MSTGNSIADYKVERCHECEDCRGTGQIKDTSEKSYGHKIPCRNCNGKGHYEKWS